METPISGPKLMRLDELREHEQYDPAHLEELLREIVRDGALKRPILVDARTMTIIDGHHRYNCMKRLGKRYIPAYLIDYSSEEIVVEPWDNKPPVTKEDVLRAALTGMKLPPKSSKHMVRVNGELRHVTYIERENPTPLDSIP
ncbi:MAG: ParB N-terminal domain-containing protein [Thaumarchaeota archaeon]|nr:ParB N-terminal domain-containing protein [Candidatus Calditenuaceae archaeon]MDW8043176.1 ParB N-terminal domain-containing protein [Nitrososphaerota archaeon]